MFEWERIIGLFPSLAAWDSTQPPNFPGRNHTTLGHSPPAACAHSQDEWPSARYWTCPGYPGTETILPHHVEVLSAGHWRAWGEDVCVMGTVGSLSDKNQPVYPLYEAVRSLVVVESSFITVIIYLFIYLFIILFIIKFRIFSVESARADSLSQSLLKLMHTPQPPTACKTMQYGVMHV